MGLKFSEAWARRLNNDVGDHVATRQTHRRFWQRVCGSIERRLSLVSFFGENLAAVAFGTFATLSAQSGPSDGVGAEVLAAGGDCVDAVIATTFALGVLRS